MRIHHIGYLVKKIDKAVLAFKDLGYEIEKSVIFDEYRQIDICFMVKDRYRIELVSPKNKDSVVYGLLKKYGNSPYHVCYICDDIEEEAMELTDKGYIKCDNSHEAVAIDNHKVCFLIHPYLGMIELLEER